MSGFLSKLTIRGAFFTLPLSYVLLSGCASTPVQQVEQVVPEVKEETNELVTVPDKPFSTDTLYALLVAEMAIDRRRYDIALGNYVQQALSTEDLMVAQRATHIARGLNARQSALEMSQLWLSLDPTSTDARLIASVELIEANHLLEAFELSKQMLEGGENAAFESIAAKAEKSDISIVNDLSSRYADLLVQYENNMGLWLGHSILLLQQGELEPALNTARRAMAIDPDSIRSSFQETRVLYKMGKTQEANEQLAKLVDRHPQNINLRARYARLIWSTSPEAAREQFLILHKSAPADPEILYSLALVEKDLGHLDDAIKHFELLLARRQYISASHFSLGEIYTSQNDQQQALDHFTQVGFGQSYLNAVLNATDILIAQNQREEAIQFISEQKSSAEGEYLEGLYSVEATVHSKAGQMNAAEKALTEGIESFPNSTRLLYARAMLYAQIDYVSAAEKDLKRVLELVPENAAALNALGYTLADQTDRYEEAYEYIKKAYELTPNDPAVIDSMGWVAYRLGNLDEALSKLRQAMDAMPDHEIAAHLGEVLWVTGKHDEAISIWKQGLELNPDSKIIHKTLHRLEAKLD